MFESFGMDRVLEPRHVLSTSAWKVDNTREIGPREVRISLRRLHIESTSFKQICIESNNDPVKIKQRIHDIVIRRGKLHNPVTDTGGVLYGIVEEIGSAYNNMRNLAVGDPVICNASLASIPLYISQINAIDRAYTQVDAEGYGILFEGFPVVKLPAGIPVNLLLYIFDESGTLYAVSQAAKGKSRFLVVGSNLLTNLLYGYVVRRAAGPSAEIQCLFDRKSDIFFKGKSIDKLLGRTFDKTYDGNILRPMECLAGLQTEGLFDMTINCADIPGAETINILSARYGGTVCFANLINNYNIALYITESTSRELNIKRAEGYVEGYEEFGLELAKELAPCVEEAAVSEGDAKEDPLTMHVEGLDSPSRRESLVEGFICESHSMARVVDEVLSVAKYDCNVLLLGDTGVGKDKVAGIIQKK